MIISRCEFLLVSIFLICLCDVVMLLVIVLEIGNFFVNCCGVIKLLMCVVCSLLVLCMKIFLNLFFVVVGILGSDGDYNKLKIDEFNC